MTVTRVGLPLKRVDHAIGRARGRRRVLVDVRTPMNLAVLRPVWEGLVVDSRVAVYVTSDDTSRIASAFAGVGMQAMLVTRPRAAWMRFDLAVNADIWDPAVLRRCARRINFPHGVAGKYDLDAPGRLPVDFSLYDRLAFANRDRMRRYLESGLVTEAQATLVGYPKVDALVAPAPREVVRARLGLDPGRPVVLYAPTFSPASSLHFAGEAIVSALLEGGVGVIVKLHDRSLDPDPRYSGGIDWRARFDAFRCPGRFLFGAAPDACDYLQAADVLVTDHSSIGFEFAVLDRPIVVFDAPELLLGARINPQKVHQLRSAAQVVADVEALGRAVGDALSAPGHLSSERRALASEMFHDVGHATGRALAVVYELLEIVPPSARAATGRLVGVTERCAP